MRTCEDCGAVISKERLEVFPDTRHCPGCSHVQKRVGFMDYAHKTASSLVTVAPDDTEQLRLARRAFKRSR